MAYSEKSTIKKAKKGDMHAFEQLVLEHEKQVFAIAIKMIGNEHDAYDISQEVFIKVYKSLHQFNFQSSFSTWIHRITVNTSIDMIRKQKHDKKNESIDQTIEYDGSTMEKQYIDPSMTPEEKIVNNEKQEEIKEALEELSENHKAIIVLRDIYGYSYEQISEIMTCSLGTVKSRLARARQNLKEVIMNNREQNKRFYV